MLPPQRAGRAPPPELAEQRAGMDQLIAAGTWATEPAPREEILGGVRVLRFGPSGPPRATVLHLHGGAFRIGCPEMIGPYAAALAVRCWVEVVCPAYRLAPEAPFPAGLADAFAAAKALQAAGSGALILAGDSAGGGLAAGAAALCVHEGIALAGLVLLSPWLDLTVSAAAYEANAATDPLFSAASARAAADLYLQGGPADHPLASPLFADVTGFPPTFVSIGEGEVLADDGRSFVERLRAAGVAAELNAVAGMEHVAVTRSLSLPGAQATFDAVAAFIGRIVAR